MITAHKTRRVAFATVFRLLSMSLCAFLLYRFSHFNGAVIGAISLSMGVSFEALFTRYLARHAIGSILKKTAADNDPALGLKDIWNYYLPLAMTPFIALSVHPLVTFFLGKSLYAIESLAVMPVIHGLSFVFRSVGLSYQEVTIALVGENRSNHRKVKNFAATLGIATSAGLALIAFTPLNQVWFHNISGLDQGLTDFALLPLQILALFPALTVLISFQRSMLIVDKRTKPVSMATLLESAGIFVVLAMGVIYSTLPGAVVAATAYVSGRIMAIAMLHLIMKKQNKVNFLQE